MAVQPQPAPPRPLTALEANVTALFVVYDNKEPAAGMGCVCPRCLLLFRLAPDAKGPKPPAHIHPWDDPGLGLRAHLEAGTCASAPERKRLFGVLNGKPQTYAYVERLRTLPRLTTDLTAFLHRLYDDVSRFVIQNKAAGLYDCHLCGAKDVPEAVWAANHATAGGDQKFLPFKPGSGTKCSSCWRSWLNRGSPLAGFVIRPLLPQPSRVAPPPRKTRRTNDSDGAGAAVEDRVTLEEYFDVLGEQVYDLVPGIGDDHGVDKTRNVTNTVAWDGAAVGAVTPPVQLRKRGPPVGFVGGAGAGGGGAGAGTGSGAGVWSGSGSNSTKSNGVGGSGAPFPTPHIALDMDGASATPSGSQSKGTEYVPPPQGPCHCKDLDQLGQDVKNLHNIAMAAQDIPMLATAVCDPSTDALALPPFNDVVELLPLHNDATGPNKPRPGDVLHYDAAGARFWKNTDEDPWLFVVSDPKNHNAIRPTTTEGKDGEDESSIGVVLVGHAYVRVLANGTASIPRGSWIRTTSTQPGVGMVTDDPHDVRVFGRVVASADPQRADIDADGAMLVRCVLGVGLPGRSPEQTKVIRDAVMAPQKVDCVSEAVKPPASADTPRTDTDSSCWSRLFSRKKQLVQVASTTTGAQSDQQPSVPTPSSHLTSVNVGFGSGMLSPRSPGHPSPPTANPWTRPPPSPTSTPRSKWSGTTMSVVLFLLTIAINAAVSSWVVHLMTQYDDRLAVLEADVGSVSASTAQLMSRVEVTETALETNVTRISMLAGRTESLMTTASGLDSRQTTTEATTSRLTAHMSVVQGDVGVLTTTVGRHSDELRSLSSPNTTSSVPPAPYPGPGVGELALRVSKLENQTSDLMWNVSMDMSRLQSEASTLSSRVGETETALTTLGTQQASTATTLNHVSNNVSAHTTAIEATVTTVSTTVTLLSNDVSDLKTDVSGVTDDVAVVSSQLSDLADDVEANTETARESVSSLNRTTSVLFDEVAALVPAGAIVPFAAATDLVVPTGWLVADGAAVSRGTFATLFAVIGTTYGTGDGHTTFNLPDLRRRSPVGAANGAEVGDVGGTTAATLTVANLPPHTHTGETAAGGGHSHTGATSEDGDHDHGGQTGGGGRGDASDWKQFDIGIIQPFRAMATSVESHSHSIAASGTHSHSFTTEAASDHTHVFTTAATGNGSPFPVQDPFLLVTYLIKH